MDSDGPGPLPAPPAPPVRPGGRVAVLGVLRRAQRPLSAQEVGERAGLHLNTARFHLDRLVADGLAARADEARATPGRPRAVYTAAGSDPGPRAYALLAEMLAGLVDTLDDAVQAASATGRAWGAHLVERAPPSQPVDAAGATERVVRLLDELGFRPAAVPLGDGVELRLRHCPFREVAQRHPDVVCGMHLALLQGALAELRAPLRAAGLEPFAEPDLCLARLAPKRPRRGATGAPGA